MFHARIFTRRGLTMLISEIETYSQYPSRGRLKVSRFSRYFHAQMGYLHAHFTVFHGFHGANLDTICKNKFWQQPPLIFTVFTTNSCINVIMFYHLHFMGQSSIALGSIRSNTLFHLATVKFGQETTMVLPLQSIANHDCLTESDELNAKTT